MINGKVSFCHNISMSEKDMNDEKRALTFDEAKMNGLVAEDYSYRDLPNDFIATLEYKVWGKSKNLKLFFCSENDNKYVLSVFYKSYAPRKTSELDFSSINIKTGMKFNLKTEANRNGNVNFLEAHAI